MKLSKRKKLTVLMYACLLLTTATVTLMNKHRRRWSVRPMNRHRNRYGQYETLVKFMKRNDKDQFFKYTRLTPELFEYLLQTVGPFLKKHPHRKALSPEQRLIMTLHFLSQGSTMQELAWSYHVGKSTMHYVIKETCSVLWDKLMPVYLCILFNDDFVAIATAFYKRWNLPNCIGALDGKHVIIQAPKHSGSEFFSYKKSFSLVLMATCDSFYKFTMVDIGGAGANHDAFTFRNFAFGKAFLNKELPIPPPTTLPKTNLVLPHFLAADQAFPLHENIMRPYPGERLQDIKTVFNYRLSRARRTIENTFGIFVQRWRILRKPIIGDIETCEQIVKAAVVLHNFIQRSEEEIPEHERRYCPTGNADYIDVNGELYLGLWRQDPANYLQSVGRVGSNNANRTVVGNRDLLAQYFMSAAGVVPWQYNKILEGSLPHQ